MAHNLATGVNGITATDDSGYYQISALQIGSYRLEIVAQGFQTEIIENLSVEVGRILVRDFQLKIGDINQMVPVAARGPLVERASVSVGVVVSERTVQEIPLNGRHFFNLGLLIPGSVTSPQNGFISAPLRGQGSLALNTAGNREDTVNVQINGINLNDQLNNILNFQPPVSSIREFKVDNSTFSAEYGRNSGAIVNVATRSGTNDLHGEVFEFFRNNGLDARNFFNFVSSEPPPFQRNQFGADIGGPIIRNKLFFFFAYEGLRQQQGVDLNSLVLNDTEREAATDPIVRRLIQLIPHPNFSLLQDHAS